MLNKQIIDIFELLDDPKANGQIVKAFLQAIDPEASVEYFLAWRRQDEDFLRPFLDAVLREAPRGK